MASGLNLEIRRIAMDAYAVGIFDQANNACFQALPDDQKQYASERISQWFSRWDAMGCKCPQHVVEDVDLDFSIQEAYAMEIPYKFAARLPIDHAIALVKEIRSEEKTPGLILQLVGCITGEIGALRQSGFTIALVDEELPSTLDGCCDQFTTLTQMESFATEADANAINPAIIALIMKIIELWLASRQ